MHFITSTTLLAASAFLTLASPIQKKAGVSAFIDDPFKDIAYNPDVPAKGDIKDDPIKDITDNLIPIQDETANATKQLEARDCIFDLYFRGIPPFVLENTVVMDGCWNLAVAGGGLCGNWVTAPGNDDDLEYNAYTDRSAGIAYAHFNFRVRAAAYFPARQSVRWTVTEIRSGTRTCVASGTITAANDSEGASWPLDSTASYSLTIQDAYE